MRYFEVMDINYINNTQLLYYKDGVRSISISNTNIRRSPCWCVLCDRGKQTDRPEPETDYLEIILGFIIISGQ